MLIYFILFLFSSDYVDSSSEENKKCLTEKSDCECTYCFDKFIQGWEQRDDEWYRKFNLFFYEASDAEKEKARGERKRRQGKKQLKQEEKREENKRPEEEKGEEEKRRLEVEKETKTNKGCISRLVSNFFGLFSGDASATVETSKEIESSQVKLIDNDEKEKDKFKADD